MKIVILFSENSDLIDSMKLAIAYSQHVPIKFHFYSEVDLVKAHLANIGMPELLLYDRNLSPAVESLPETLKKALLTELRATSVKEVFIYQQMDNFIIDVIKTLNSFELQSNVNFNESTAISMRGSLWMLDPCESIWSKRCFIELQRKFYTQAKPTVSVDASMFGDACQNLSHAAYESLSTYISDFVWDKSSYLEKLKVMRQHEVSHIVHGVSHPMDILSLDPEFWEMFGMNWRTSSINQMLYSGMLSESQLKTISPYYDNLVIMAHEPMVTQEKLYQIQDWFAQIAPSMRIKICHQQLSTGMPEKHAENIWQWVMFGKEG